MTMVNYWSRSRKEKGNQWKRIARKEIWDHIVAKMPVEVAESGCAVFSNVKDTETCRFTMLQIKKQLQLFSHICFCKAAPSLRSSRKEECESLAAHKDCVYSVKACARCDAHHTMFVAHTHMHVAWPFLPRRLLLFRWSRRLRDPGHSVVLHA